MRSRMSWGLSRYVVLVGGDGVEMTGVAIRVEDQAGITEFDIVVARELRGVRSDL